MNSAANTNTFCFNGTRMVRIATASAVLVARVVGRRVVVSQRVGSVFRVTGVADVERYSVAHGVETFEGYSTDPADVAALTKAARAAA